jgi:hypothetical protein
MKAVASATQKRRSLWIECIRRATVVRAQALAQIQNIGLVKYRRDLAAYPKGRPPAPANASRAAARADPCLNAALVQRMSDDAERSTSSADLGLIERPRSDLGGVRQPAAERAAKAKSALLPCL